MLYAFVPPVVFFNIARLEFTPGVAAGILLGWLACTLAGLIAWWAARAGLGLSQISAASITNGVIQANTGYLGLPLAVAVLGSSHLPEAIAYNALIGTPVFLVGAFGVAAAFGTTSGPSTRARLRAFLVRNPPLLAAIAGLIAPAALAPQIAVDATEVLVFALLPLGFFAVGIVLAEETESARVPFPPLSRGVVLAVVCRLILAPALLFALSVAILDIPDAYLLLAAMPTGINGLVVAHAYGLDVPLSAGIIAWTTLVGIAGIVGALVLF